MILSCSLCSKSVDSEKEEVVVTVKWILEELLKLNDIQNDTEFPRVVRVCQDCWENTFKKKLDKKDYYWKFNKEI